MLEVASLCAMAQAGYRHYLAQRAQASEVQERLLLSILRDSQDCEYGRRYDFSSIASVADFQKAVPLTRYNDYRAAIERMLSGEAGVTTSHRVVRFASSSGTTSNPKLVPLTDAYIKESFAPFYVAALGATLATDPSLAGVWDSTLNFKWDPERRQERTADGVRIGGLSQIDFTGEIGEARLFEPGAQCAWSHVPAEIADDVERLVCKLAIAASFPIDCVIGVNPRLLANMPTLLAERTEDVLRAVRDGVEGAAPANPERARELWALADNRGHLEIPEIWSNIRSVMCWDGSVAGLYVPTMAKAWGADAKVLTAPLALTEAPVAVPSHEHPGELIPAFTATFLEFSDIHNGGAMRLLGELEVGRCYGVITTNRAGFYRYDTGDLVEVTGISAGVARLRYLGRSLRAPGCPADEATLLNLLELAARRCEGSFVNGFITPDPHNPTGLAVCIELTAGQDVPKGIVEHAGFAARIVQLPSGWFYQDWKRAIVEGRRPPQVKDSVYRPASPANLAR